mmetsp:Transcript_21153/g.59181  ORF Transcript_21153/g.59181 Transcript_21153/m.59181 type:complete len:503 (+) Transcript_21153:131-1639(+)
MSAARTPTQTLTRTPPWTKTSSTPPPSVAGADIPLRESRLRRRANHPLFNTAAESCELPAPGHVDSKLGLRCQGAEGDAGGLERLLLGSELDLACLRREKEHLQIALEYRCDMALRQGEPLSFDVQPSCAVDLRRKDEQESDSAEMDHVQRLKSAVARVDAELCVACRENGRLREAATRSAVPPLSKNSFVRSRLEFWEAHAAPCNAAERQSPGSCPSTRAPSEQSPSPVLSSRASAEEQSPDATSWAIAGLSDSTDVEPLVASGRKDIEVAHAEVQTEITGEVHPVVVAADASLERGEAAADETSAERGGRGTNLRGAPCSERLLNFAAWRLLRGKLAADAEELGLNELRSFPAEQPQFVRTPMSKTAAPGPWGKLRCAVRSMGAFRRLLEEIRGNEIVHLYGGDWRMRLSAWGHLKQVRSRAGASSVLRSLLHEVRRQQTEKLYEGSWTDEALGTPSSPSRAHAGTMTSLRESGDYASAVAVEGVLALMRSAPCIDAESL